MGQVEESTLLGETSRSLTICHSLYSPDMKQANDKGESTSQENCFAIPASAARIMFV